jgi:hypothetical protein
VKSKRKRKQKPLFYISQPDIETPKPYMQESFLYKNGELEGLSLESELNENQDAAEKEAPKANIEKDELVEPMAQEQKLTEEIPENKKRSFNELTLEEKLKHLKLVPASIAKVRYEFKTIDNSYKGYFLANKNGTVLIHSVNSRKKSVSILEEDLVDIQRIGL